MPRSNPTRAAGFSLVEVVIVIALLGTIIGSVLAVLRTTNRAQGVSGTAARLESQSSRVLDQIATRLRASGLSTMTPTQSAPFSSPTIDFQPSVGIVGGATVWGPVERIAFGIRPGEIDNGVDDDGNGFADEGRILWTQDVGGAAPVQTVLSNGVSEFLQGEVPNGADDNGNGLIDEGGLCFDIDGTSVIVRLTLLARDSSGVVLTKTAEERIFFRNR